MRRAAPAARMLLLVLAAGLTAGAGIALLLPDAEVALRDAKLESLISPASPAHAAIAPATKTQRSLSALKTDLFRPPPRVLDNASPPYRMARPVRTAKAGLDMYAMTIAAARREGGLVTGSVSRAAPPKSAKPNGPIKLASLGNAVTMTDAGPATPAWRRFAAPDATPRSGPAIVIVLDDLGSDVLATRRAIGLPPQITLSFLPYASAAAALAEEGRALGHEILVHLPMEPYGSADPGTNALRAVHTDPELVERIEWHLGRLDGYVGVNNHMGSRLTERDRPMRTVMRELRRRGLLFLDSRTTSRSRGAAMAVEEGIPALERDVFLDHAQGPDHLLSQLFELERVARSQGTAIAIGHPHPLTLDVLEVWLRGLDAKGLTLVPLTALLDVGGAG